MKSKLADLLVIKLQLWAALCHPFTERAPAVHKTFSGYALEKERCQRAKEEFMGAFKEYKKGTN